MVRLRLAGAGLFVWVLASCSSGGGSAGPTQVESGIYVEPVTGFFQSVAPAGELVVAAGDAVCVQRSDEDDVSCAEMPDEASAGALAGGWARDGSRFVFHDRITTATTFVSEVWSFEAESVEVSGVVAGASNVAVFDVAVSTSGAEVALTGSLRDAAGAPAFGTFLVGADGELVRVSDVAGEVIGWLPDSSGLIVSSSLPDTEGLWLVDRSDPVARLVFDSDEAFGPPSLSAISADGKWALVYWREYVAREFFPAGTSHYSLVSLDTGEAVPLKADVDGADFVGPGFAAFSVDGTQIAYTYRGQTDGTGDRPLVLVTRTIPEGDEKIIEPDLFDSVGRPPTPDQFVFDGEPAATWVGDSLTLRAPSWALIVELK